MNLTLKNELYRMHKIIIVMLQSKSGSIVSMVVVRQASNVLLKNVGFKKDSTAAGRFTLFCYKNNVNFVHYIIQSISANFTHFKKITNPKK